MLFNVMMNEANQAATELAYPNSMNVLFKVVVAAYLLYIAAIGKGKLLDNKFLKIPTQKYRLYMRLIAGAGALFVLGTSAIELLVTDGSMKVLATVLWILGLVALVGMLVLNVVFTDHKAQIAAREQEDREMMEKQRNKMRAAFVFDEEDEKDADADESKEEPAEAAEGEQE